MTPTHKQLYPNIMRIQIDLMTKISMTNRNFNKNQNIQKKKF